MLVVALTGGIGSGKSTVAQLFSEKGITVIDTDQLSRDLTQRGEPALKEIVQRFGESILNADQTLNRTKLRAIIFQDQEQRDWLEKLLHPLIRNKMNDQIIASASPYCIVVIPLLFETQPNPLINRVLVVDATEDEQISRTTARDQSDSKKVKAILKTQLTREDRLALADDIIDNHGTKDGLITQVDQFHQFYLSLSL